MTKALLQVRQGPVFLRVLLALSAAVAICALTQSWLPPFPFRPGQVPRHEIRARVDFSLESPPVVVSGDPLEGEEPVAPASTIFSTGATLAPAGTALAPEAIDLLRAEHERYQTQLPLARRVERGLAMLGVVLALLLACGYVIHRRDRRLLTDLRRLGTLLAATVATVALCYWVDPYQAEIIPLLLCGMTYAVAYHRDIAVVLSLSLATIVTMALGQGLHHFLLLLGIAVTAVVQLGRVRTRSKPIEIGVITALVAILLTFVVGILDEQPLAGPLVNFAVRTGLWTLAAGFLLAGLLPFIERWFGVLTDLSLLELGDVTHPLLQELMRRAPGTYNHSISVGSLAEAAAESIGARGLLVRVGAYFHDIGKMLKPDYFVENQGPLGNRHDTLAPAMSTLIIVAHVKDGADLARQHHLPEPIIDFILQHHGTTLLEFFYHRAHQRSTTGSNGDTVQESAYRYPGPKPQTIEAAVLMLSDAVESACRVLVEPTPSRIENLVEEIAMKRLLDGQFDECNLTLKQLRLVQQALAKGLTAVYHGRVKYPEAPKTAIRA